MTDTTVPSEDRSRLRIALLAIAGVVALAALYLLVLQPLLGEGSAAGDAETLDIPVGQPLANDAAAQDATGAEASADTAPQDADAAPEGDPLPETYEVFSARDPFQQLVTENDGTAEATPVSTGAATGTDATTTSTDTTAPSATRVGTTVVRVIEVTTVAGVERASITVNGTGHSVAEGETFATSFRVLDISGDCATLLFGDSRFTLCAGEEIRK